MKQYCRYCSHAHYGDVVYCDVKNDTMSDESAKRVNKCKDFEFNELDVFCPYDENGNSCVYKPREKKAKRQLSLFEDIK